MKNYIAMVFLCVLGACGGEITQSGAEYYEEFSYSYCEAIIEQCNSGINLENCVDVSVQEICTSDPAACSERYTVNAGDWQACLDAPYSMTCDALIQGIVPSECFTVEVFR